MSAPKRILTLACLAVLVFAALVACGPAPTPQTVTVKETVPVQQTVVVKETVPVQQTVIVQQPVPVTATPEPVKPKGTMTVAVTTDIAALEVPRAPERNAFLVSWTLYDSLLFHAPDGSFQPALAEKYDVSSDGLTYTFYLRKGVTFHNGEPFNADSVVYTWQVYTQNDVQYKNYFTGATGVEKVDDYTVKVTTKTPNASLIPFIALGWTMLPPKYHAQVGAKEFAQKPVGTGPFMLKEWVKGDHITVVANPNYWRKGYPLIATIIFKPIPEAATRVAALRRGEIDLATRLSADDAQALLGVQGTQVVRYLADRVYYVAFNNLSTGKDTPIKDTKVRLAMNYAVDKQAIIKSIFNGYGTVAAGLIGPADMGYEGSQPLPYDVTKAKALLAEAGYANGFSMAMACPTNAFLRINDVCQAVAGYFDKVGIKIDLQFMEPNTFWDLQTKKQTPPLYVDSWSCAYGEAFNRFQGALGKGASYAQWYDDKFDSLTNKIVSTVDIKQRTALYQQMQQLTQQDPPFVYLYYPDSFEATRSRVVGYTPYASEEYYLWGVSLSDGK